MEKLKKFLNDRAIILVILFSAIAAWPLFLPGYYSVHDEMHVAWLYEIDRAVETGQIPPRFVPDLSFGFGYPLYNFVYPLPYYLGELFHTVGFPLTDSLKAVLIISLVAGALAMYQLLRAFAGNYLSMTGAIIYTFTPYRAVDIYVRGAVGEALAFVFLPLIALSVIKLTSSVNFRFVGIGALSLAGLVLTHNITGYMFIPYILLLGVIRLLILKKSQLTILIQSGLTVILGLAVSLYFWLPALLDNSLMKYDTVYNFIDHFPTLKQLITPFWGYGASVPGPYDGMSFFMGTVNIFLVVAGIVVSLLIWKKFSQSEKILLVWVMCSFFLTIFMMNFRSTFIWEKAPLIPYFQFPWRFLIITTFVTPLLIIVLSKLKYSYILTSLLLILTVAVNFNYFRPETFSIKNDNYYLNRYIPVPVASSAYYQINEEYLRLPKATTIRPDKNYPVAIIEDGVETEIKQLSILNSTITVSAQKDTVLDFYKYNFPGWVAEVDGLPVPIKSGFPFGQILVNVPQGIHQVHIYFTETTFKKVLDYISLLAIIFSLVLIFGNKILPKKMLSP